MVLQVTTQNAIHAIIVQATSRTVGFILATVLPGISNIAVGVDMCTARLCRIIFQAIDVLTSDIQNKTVLNIDQCKWLMIISSWW